MSICLLCHIPEQPIEHGVVYRHAVALDLADGGNWKPLLLATLRSGVPRGLLQSVREFGQF